MVENTTERQEGQIANPLHPYGVGIDTHRDFIQICVLVKNNTDMLRFEREFSTKWKSLVMARQWVISMIEQNSLPRVLVKHLHYVIESTSTYHMPVCRAFEGKAHVINPHIAGSTKRKTDVLDSRMLAMQGMSGLWPVSFAVPDSVQELRMLVQQSANAQREATRISNRINGNLLRFGHTVGSSGSVRSSVIRPIIEDMCRLVEDFKFSDNLPNIVKEAAYICPKGLPRMAAGIILLLYEYLDTQTARAKAYEKEAMEFAKQLKWETSPGHYVGGNELIANLLTIPGVGPSMVLTWLCEVVTPARFPNTKALAAFAGTDPTLKISAGKITSHIARTGNKRLHYKVIKIAGTIINRRNEPLGQWGYQIYRRHAKGGYKKACGAVARRVLTALYYVHKKNEPFSYEGYNFYKFDFPNMTLQAMGLSARLARILEIEGLTESSSIMANFTNGNLQRMKGIGPKAIAEIDEWRKSHRTWR